MRVGDRVRTPEGQEGVIVSMRRDENSTTRYWNLPPAWVAIVRFDGDEDIRRAYFATQLVDLSNPATAA